jgi:hypothetical protein
MRATKLKLSILLVFAVYISACGLYGSAQQKQEAQQKQVAPDSQQALEKQEALESQKKEWLGYWPAVVELEGKLSVKTFFGPPNFGENPKTDSKQRSRILSLDKPINVRAKDETDPTLGPSVDNVRELQLIFDESLRELIGKKVIVKGTLLHAHSGYHHTDVLLDVESIRLAASD